MLSHKICLAALVVCIQSIVLTTAQGPFNFNDWSFLWKKSQCVEQMSANEHGGGRLLITARDPTSDAYRTAPKLEWTKYNRFLKNFVNECALEARQQGLVSFSIRYFGECWGWKHHVEDSVRKSADCVNGMFKKTCGKEEQECTGRRGSEFVYHRVCTDMSTGLTYELGTSYKPSKCQECTCGKDGMGFMECTEMENCTED